MILNENLFFCDANLLIFKENRVNEFSFLREIIYTRFVNKLIAVPIKIG
jgi:hypothetical protein